MQAITKSKLDSVVSLSDGFRIANALKVLDPAFFTFFDEGTRRSLVLKSEGLYQEERLVVREENWRKIVKGIIEFFRGKELGESTNSDKLAKFIDIFEEVEEDMVNKLANEHKASMEYFCLVFILFVQKMFPKYWGVIDHQLNLKDQLNEHLKNIETQESTEKKPETGRSHFLREKLDEFENLYHEEKKKRADLETSYMELENQIQHLAKQLDHRELLIKKNQIIIESQKENIEELNKMLKEQSFDRSQLTELNFLKNENGQLLQELESLKLRLKRLEDSQKDNMMILSIDSKLGELEAIARLKQSKQDLENALLLKETTISELRQSINQQRTLIYNGQQKMEKIESQLSLKHKDFLEVSRSLRNKENECSILSGQFERLKEQYDSLFNEMRSQQYHSDSEHEVDQTQEDEENFKEGHLFASKLGLGGAEKINLYEAMDQMNNLYTLELKALYALLHDHMVCQLTGESLQDLIKKKMAEKFPHERVEHFVLEESAILIN